MAITSQDDSFHAVMSRIRDRVMGRLQDAATELGIKDENSIFYGHQQRIGTVTSKALWVLPVPYQPEASGLVSVNHKVPYNIAALVKNSDPQAGIIEAEKMAHIAYDLLMSGRSLDDTVSKVMPGQIDPGYEGSTNQQLQFTAVQLVFEFRRKE